MFNSKDEYNDKSAERIRPSPFGNDSSGSKCRSNFKILNPKSKNYEEDEKLKGIEFSAKNNSNQNFQNLQKNYSIFNINEMSPTMNNYYPHLLLSNMDENKEKLCETPIKFNPINNDIDWYRGIQGRDNSLPDSPLFPRNLNFKSNKNLDISSSFQKIHYCYNYSNITQKNLRFEIENTILHNNIHNNLNNNNLNNGNNHLYNNNNNNFQVYQPKKLFNNPQNQYGGPSRLQQEKISAERNIILSSDDDHVSKFSKKIPNFNNLDIESKSSIINYSPKRNELKDNCILNSTISFQKDKVINKRESIRKKLKIPSASRIKHQRSDKKIKSLILTTNNQTNRSDYSIKQNNVLQDEGSKPLVNINIQKTKCTCSKTQCVKKYCECFSNGKFCVDCECENCHNIPENIDNLNEIRAKEYSTIRKDKEDVLQKTNIIVCNCTRSGCSKKYCECFKAGKKCSDECRCIHCDNLGECRISRIISKNRKIYLSEKTNNSKIKYRSPIIIDGLAENSFEEGSKPFLYRSFDTNAFKLYNINVLISGEVISISEKNENLNRNIIENENVLNFNKKILKSHRNVSKKRIYNRHLLIKKNKKNISKSENINDMNNKSELYINCNLEFSKEKKFQDARLKIEKEINLQAELDPIPNNELNNNIISELSNENNKYRFRRSARLSLNRKKDDSNKDIIIMEYDNYLPEVDDLNYKYCKNKKNDSKNKNDFKSLNKTKRISKKSKKNPNDNQNQNLDFYSSVLNKKYFEKVGSMISSKNSSFNNISDSAISFKGSSIEHNTEGENNIFLSSNKKTKNDKFIILDSASNINDSNKNNQMQKITETPKLCEKKRYRNTTSSKVRTLNEDVYIKTNSTLNQTPILNQEKNKKKIIDVDGRIVKNLQYKY